MSEHSKREYEVTYPHAKFCPYFYSIRQQDCEPETALNKRIQDIFRESQEVSWTKKMLTDKERWRSDWLVIKHKSWTRQGKLVFWSTRRIRTPRNCFIVSSLSIIYSCYIYLINLVTCMSGRSLDFFLAPKNDRRIKDSHPGAKPR